MAKYNLWQKVPFALVSKLPFYFVASMMADETNCRKMAEAHPKKLSKFWPLETLPLFQLQRETDGRGQIWIISLLTWRHQTCSCTHVNLYRSKQTMADRTWSPCLTDRMDCRGHFVRALSFLPRSLNSCVDSKPGYRFNKKVQTHSASNPPRNHHAKTI